jgi:hypothetical protein
MTVKHRNILSGIEEQEVDDQDVAEHEHEQGSYPHQAEQALPGLGIIKIEKGFDAVFKRSQL